MKAASDILRNGLMLALIAVGGVSLLTVVHQVTKAPIAEAERRVVEERLGQVLPSNTYDNDLLLDWVEVRDATHFQHAGPVRVHRARRDGQPVAVIMQVTAPDGYNGDIRLLVAIDAEGAVLGVRVIAHRETPGLGDPIEVRRSDWIESFRGTSIGAPDVAGWTVRKDGGEFDQFTGATITPRAVVRAVRRALEYHDRHRDELYAAPSHGGAS